MDEGRGGVLSVFTSVSIKSLFFFVGGVFTLVTATRVLHTVVSRLGDLVVNDGVARGCTERPGQQAGAALSTWELNVAVRTVSTGIKGSVFQQGGIGLVVYTGPLVSQTVGALGAVRLGEQSIVREVVQSRWHLRGVGLEARHIFLFTTSTFYFF